MIKLPSISDLLLYKFTIQTIYYSTNIIYCIR